jgi:molybdopterin molybdotransferase
MFNLDEAQALVVQHTLALKPQRVPILEALGLLLEEDVLSDIASPPHDKALVDGYAVVAEDLTNGCGELHVHEEVMAGDVPQHRVTTGTATRIMTGAPVPEGASAVVMMERCDRLGPQRIRIADPALKPGQHIMPAGTSLRRGDLVLQRGVEIRAIEVGLLAEVGRADALVIPRPHVAVLATGNELMPVHETPTAGKLRNSNGPMLLAAARRAGAQTLDLGIARDHKEQLADRISQGLNLDVLILSGGVSAGALDLVPKVLNELGVRQVFHHVRLKPGKPVWFGVHSHAHGSTLVFGLPGNPVSSLVTFQLLVQPALRRLAGRNSATGSLVARLVTAHAHHGDRPTFYPARLHEQDGLRSVQLVAWHGSADLASLAAANCLVHFPAGSQLHAAGDKVEVVEF